MEEKLLWGFDKSGKGIGVLMIKGVDMGFYAFWWSSKNKYTYLPYSEISNPEKASVKYEGEIKSPDIFVETMIVNNKPGRTTTCTRVK
jgi:hypothetical protein